MFWIWILATLSAFFLKGLCGFANTMVFDSILGFAVNNVNISPIELILGFPTNIILAWQNRKKLDYKVWVPIVILILMGSIPGALLLKEVNAKGLKIFFGIITLESLKMTACLFPFMLVGLFSGIYSSRILDDKLVKKIVILLLIISGIVLVIKNMMRVSKV